MINNIKSFLKINENSTIKFIVVYVGACVCVRERERERCLLMCFSSGFDRTDTMEIGL